MIKVVKHGTVIEIIEEIARQGKAISKRTPIRTRVLIQTLGRQRIVLRGSLMMSGAEIDKLLTAHGY